MECTQSDNEDIFKDIVSKKQIYSAAVRNGIKAYVVSHVVKLYDVIAVRFFIDKEKGELFKVRRLVEEKLDKESHIKMFVSCLTAIEIKSRETQEVCVGISFWIAFDWPSYGVQAFENLITKLIMEEGADVISCKTVKSRGIIYYSIFY